MSKCVIKGRFIYHAYYKSVSEMKEDTDLEVDYFVSVIDETGNKQDYKIVKDQPADGSIYERLDNKLYALSVTLSNDIKIDVNKPYSTDGPTDVDLGAIKKGSEFSAKDTNEVFDSLFYYNKVGIDIETNFSDPILIRGENNVLRKITFNVNRTRKRIVKEEVTIGTNSYTYNDSWNVGGSYSKTYNITFTRDLNITLAVTNVDGEKYTVSYTIKTQYPTYYSVINPDVLPSVSDIKNMNKTFDKLFTGGGSFINTTYFVAIPETKTIKNFRDENGIDLLTDAKNYGINILFGNQDRVRYNCYYLNKMTADNADFSVLTEEV